MFGIDDRYIDLRYRYFGSKSFWNFFPTQLWLSIDQSLMNDFFIRIYGNELSGSFTYRRKIKQFAIFVQAQLLKLFFFYLVWHIMEFSVPFPLRPPICFVISKRIGCIDFGRRKRRKQNKGERRKIWAMLNENDANAISSFMKLFSTFCLWSLFTLQR